MEEKKYKSFTELKVWKKARELKLEISELIKSFPKIEQFRLSDQLIRSVRSINSNISEGHGRYTFKDQINFCIMARGSLSETHNHLIDAYDEKFITEDKLNYFKAKIDLVEALLNGYIAYLRKQ